MPSIARFAPLSILSLLLLVEAGCNQSALDSKTLAMHRSRLALAEEPEDVQTVADVRSTLLGVEEADHDGHDGDGDGHSDHDAADHDATEDEAEGNDEADASPAGPDEKADDHDHDGDGHPDHEPGEHDSHAAHGHATEPQEVAVVGHIGGLANPWGTVQPDYPFAKSQAVLFLADPQAVIENEESGHNHAPGEECAFCAAHAADNADMLAMIQFVDENGKVLPVDVRDLFDVKAKDTIVVSGAARITEGGILVVDAKGLYIRK